MNATTHNPNQPGSAEETLRLIAGLPAPEGLEGRVQAALRQAPRTGRVLTWPAARRPESGWMRAAAAAAIVFVVAGGGWGVFSHVERGQPAKTTVLPQGSAAGGFSSAGAIRMPQTLNGPVVTHRAPEPTAQTQALKKVKALKAPAKTRRAAHAGAGKKTVQPVAEPGR